MGLGVSTSPRSLPSAQSAPLQDISIKLLTHPMLSYKTCTYSLQPRLSDVLVRFEKRPDVDCLAAPEVSVYRPVQS